MSNDKIFADGFIFKRRESAPEFVIGNISVKVEDAVAFLNANQKNGWVNVGIKESQAGNPYMFVDNFEPKPRNGGDTAPNQAPVQESDVPF